MTAYRRDALQVAALAKIPSKNQAAFCQDLIALVENANALDLDWRQPQRFAWFGRIAAQAAGLLASLTSESLSAGRCREIATLLAHTHDMHSALTALVEQGKLARRDWRQPQRFTWLAPIAAQSADLLESLASESLSADQRAEVKALIGCGVRDAGCIAGVIAFLCALDALAEHGKAVSASDPPKTLHKRGRPSKPFPWQADAPAPECFTAALQTLVAHHGGERLGFYLFADASAGALHVALELLRPHLTGGFLDSLTAAVIRRLVRS